MNTLSYRGLGMMILASGFIQAAPAHAQRPARAPVNSEGDGGPATRASVFPSAIRLDARGNLYIMEAMAGVVFVRKVGVNGLISTVPSDSDVFGRGAIAVDTGGNIYLASSLEGYLDTLAGASVLRLTARGVVSIVAGNGRSGFSGDGGPATRARLGSVSALAVDARGNLYIAGDNRIRRVGPNGVITTIAGNGKTGFSGDGGAATLASLTGSLGMVLDARGNLYFADLDNNRIRKIDPRGIITTVAGSGPAGFSGDGGAATSARLNGPSDVAVDAAGAIYIADTGNGRVRKVDPNGTISTVAGNGTQAFRGDGGAATSASFGWPESIAVDAGGNIYITDRMNGRVRRVSPNGVVNSVAGNGPPL
jgi:sugar lactone lactonase YvrE